MNWLNYHHLFYFWTIAKEESIANASRKLNITQSSLSSQLKSLEQNFDTLLFDRVGRKLVLTDQGKHVYKVAEKIFDLGNMLMTEVENSHLGLQKQNIRVGAVGTLSKNIQQLFLKPLLHDSKKKVNIFSGDLTSLMDKLSTFDVDMVITNTLPENYPEQYMAHKIYSFNYSILINEKSYRRDLDLASHIKEKGICIPATVPYIRLKIIEFLEQHNLDESYIRAEIEDTALLRLFASEGETVVMIPRIGVYRDLMHSSLHVFQSIKNINETFYLIARKATYELLNLDILITHFKELFIKGDRDD